MKPIEASEWSAWHVELGCRRTSWVAKRTARGFYVQFLNAAGDINGGNPCRFRSEAAAQAAIDKHLKKGKQ